MNNRDRKKLMKERYVRKYEPLERRSPTRQESFWALREARMREAQLRRADDLDPEWVAYQRDGTRMTHSVRLAPDLIVQGTQPELLALAQELIETANEIQRSFLPGQSIGLAE